MTEITRTIQKRTGNFLEDFRPGQVFRHKGGKTLTEGLFTTFTEFAMTSNPLTKNARYARAYGFDGLTSPPGLTMLIAFSQTVEDISENARANLEYIDMKLRRAGLHRGHDRGRDQGARREARRRAVRTSASSTSSRPRARTSGASDDEPIVATWQRKVQVYKGDDAAERRELPDRAPTPIDCELWHPALRPESSSYKEMAHLTSPDSYFEDLEVGSRIEHSRGRTVTE